MDCSFSSSILEGRHLLSRARAPSERAGENDRKGGRTFRQVFTCACSDYYSVYLFIIVIKITLFYGFVICSVNFFVDLSHSSYRPISICIVARAQ